MKRVFLLRHADASKDRASHEDFERPLTEEGREEAAWIGAFMREADICIECVICSSAVRTHETLEHLGAIPGQPRIRFTRELYDATPAQILEIIRRCEEPCSRLLVIGHNPGLKLLAQSLVDRRRSKESRVRRLDRGLPTGALLRLRFDADSWPEIGSGEGKLATFKTPKDAGSPIAPWRGFPSGANRA